MWIHFLRALVAELGLILYWEFTHFWRILKYYHELVIFYFNMFIYYNSQFQFKVFNSQYFSFNFPFFIFLNSVTIKVRGRLIPIMAFSILYGRSYGFEPRQKRWWLVFLYVALVLEKPASYIPMRSNVHLKITI